MALPTPLTPAQAGGAHDAGEHRVRFNTGDHRGMSLLVDAFDANIGDSILDGSITVEGPTAFRLPVMGSLNPASIASNYVGTIQVLGSNFISSDLVLVNGNIADTTYVSPIRIDFTAPTGLSEGPHPVSVRTVSGFKSRVVMLTVTAPGVLSNPSQAPAPAPAPPVCE